MQSVCVSYVGYFNKKYKRVGTLFQDRYKASMITNDAYLQHISRYIHLNPKNYKSWKYSSLPYYLNTKAAKWVNHQRILDIFEGDSYIKFLDDYESSKEALDEIKHELAN